MSWGSNAAPFESKVQSLNHELHVVEEKSPRASCKACWLCAEIEACSLRVTKICLFPNKSYPLQWAENKPLSGIATQSKSSCQWLSKNTARTHPLEHALEGTQAERLPKAAPACLLGREGRSCQSRWTYSKCIWNQDRETAGSRLLAGGLGFVYFQAHGLPSVAMFARDIKMSSLWTPDVHNLHWAPLWFGWRQGWSKCIQNKEFKICMGKMCFQILWVLSKHHFISRGHCHWRYIILSVRRCCL